MATHIPLEGLPKPGQFPELDAQTRVPTLIGISVAFATASTVAVGLRLYTRGFVVRALGMDDATIAFAQVCLPSNAMPTSDDMTPEWLI